MHARIDELISLRDARPVDAATAAHVNGCAQCGAELARLGRLRSQLQGLASFEPPALAWEQVARRLAAPARVRKHDPAALATFATAAAVALLMVLAPWWPPSARQERARPDAPPIATLVARSQRLESTLHALPRRPAVEVAANSALIHELESRIQQVDAQLGSDPGPAGDRDQVRELWHTRVQLLNSLVGVRYAEAVHAGYYTTSTAGEY